MLCQLVLQCVRENLKAQYSGSGYAVNRPYGHAAYTRLQSVCSMQKLKAHSPQKAQT